MEYPTRHGISIPTCELDLPETRLNPNRRQSFNEHHECWTKKRMGRFLITQTLRDLERHQEYMPVDVHNWVHDKYSPPRFPKLEDAMRDVQEAYEQGENLKIFRGHCVGYVTEPITEERIQQLYREYERLKA